MVRNCVGGERDTVRLTIRFCCFIIFVLLASVLPTDLFSFFSFSLLLGLLTTHVIMLIYVVCYPSSTRVVPIMRYESR